MGVILLLRAALFALLIAAAPAATAFAPQHAGQERGPLPIFDTHIHYSQDVWSLYSVDEALAIFDQSGIGVALVSSTPDDGTLLLYERAPDRVVPILRPYRTHAEISTWTQDPSIVDYLRERLASSRVPYRGIGEFHMYAGEADRPVVADVVRLANDYNLMLHAHADAQALEELLAQHPSARVLWAHAGMSAAPQTVQRLLDRYSDRLWVELALRYDVASAGRVDPNWRALFERYPDRLMVGTDTWIPSQWTRLPQLMQAVQGWLLDLPPELADKLAWRNAACLFGSPTTAIPRAC